ncbi:MAG TPA: NAD(P)H-binding protein [Candidatus Angelobacter sp.]
MDPRTAVLLGASGLVGRYCLRALLENDNWNKVVALARRDLGLAAHPRLEQSVVTDMSKLAAADFAGANDVFCATGTTIRKAGSQEEFLRIDYEMPLSAARAALEAGTQQFILVSSVGADPGSKNFYLRTKGELERDLIRLKFRAIHILRPGLLLGHREEFRPGERMATRIAPLLNLTLYGPLKRYRSIAAEKVGRAMVGAAKQEKSGTFVYEYDDIVRLAAV